MTSSLSKLNTLVATLLSASLTSSICAMENINEGIGSTHKDIIVVQTERERLINRFSFYVELAQENPEISIRMADQHYILSEDELHFFNSNLITIPKSIGKFSELTTLILVSNKLTVLPKEIGLLTNLTTLYLMDNQLKELPSSFENLTKLDELFISDNQFRVLPACFTKMLKLRNLNIMNNQLSEFPQIEKLTELKILSLADNQIEVIPSNIWKISKLEYLHLDGNKIRELPKTICHLSSLIELRLQKNNLSKLPLEIYKLKNLKTLKLKKNSQLGIHSKTYGPRRKDAEMQPFFNFYEQMSLTWEQNIPLILAFNDGDWCLETIGIEMLPQDIVVIIQRILIALTKER